MEKITAEIYKQDMDRYILVSGDQEGAPTCNYGNKQEWVGYDNKEKNMCDLLNLYLRDWLINIDIWEL